jgi:hypothetical protein
MIGTEKLKKIWIGRKFGRLTVIDLYKRGEKRKNCKGKDSVWKCLCSCGKIKNIRAHGLLCQDTKSCGCLYIETRGIPHSKHSMYGTKTYKVWGHMLSRCRNLNNADYKFYGGRGITVSEDWKDFRNFYRDMGECPKGKEIDRTDNNLGYFNGNCRWVTHKENCRNTRKNRIITIKGISKPLVEWSEILSINQNTLRARLNCRKTIAGAKIYLYRLIGGR